MFAYTPQVYSSISSMPNLAMTGQVLYRGPSIITKSVQFTVFGPIGTTLYTDDGELWSEKCTVGGVCRAKFRSDRGKGENRSRI